MNRADAQALYFSEYQAEVGHGRRALHGGAASIIARFVTALIQVGSVLILARLLTPSDYGLVAMVTAITGFAPLLVSLGTPDAVAQRRHVTQQEVAALFWISISVGVGAMLLIASSGPIIAWFYGEPRLTTIAMVSSLSFLASALTCQHNALMRRAMKFQELSALEVGATLLSAICAVALATIGFGYWALVLRPVAMYSFLAAGIWLRCGWRPPRPRITPAVKEMVRFGLNTTGFALTDFAGKAGDKVTIGYRGGATTLGFYQNADFIYGNLLDVLVSTLFGVATTGLSKVAHDRTEFRRLWAKAVSTLSFYAMPAFGLLAVTSRDVIALLLGAKWAMAGVLLSVLALRGIPHVIERTFGWLHVAAGRTDRWMRWGIIATTAQIVALVCGLPFGPFGIATAYVLCMFLLFIPGNIYAGRAFGIGTRDLIGVAGRQFVSALAAAAIGFAVRFSLMAHSGPIPRIAVLTAAYLGSYLLLVVVVMRLRAPVGVVLSLLRDVLPARVAEVTRVPQLIEWANPQP